MKTATNNGLRVARVNATGKRYVVQQLTLGKTDADSKVHCWGELTSYKYDRVSGAVGSAKYDGTKTFLMTAVTIESVDRNVKLFSELFEQTKTSRREAGHVIIGNTDHGTREQYERAQAMA